MKYADGRLYEGSFKNGKPFGKGVKIWPDGRKYDGHWKNGMPAGLGTKVYPDGSKKVGYWQKEKFIEGSKISSIVYITHFRGTSSFNRPNRSRIELKQH